MSKEPTPAGCLTGMLAMFVSLPMWYVIVFWLLQKNDAPAWLWAMFWVYVPVGFIIHGIKAVIDD